jgi:hypothetical protein
METTVRKQTPSTTLSTDKPKRLSKLGQWRRDNPGGICIIHERRKANA